MTAQTGLAVSRDGSANGTTSKGFRLALGGLLAKNGASGLDVRKGVLWDNGGLVVTGTAGMAYSVRSCNVVVMPSATQGPVVVPNDAALSVATGAAPGSNSRIDVIWVRQHLVAADGGADTDVVSEWNVTQGTAAASPAAPAIPAGAVELAQVPVTAGTTATSSLTIQQTHLWTAADGAPIPVRSDGERSALTAFDGLLVNHLGLNQIQRYNAGNWHPVGGPASAAGTGISPTIAVANTTYSKAIVFPVGRFAVAPAVTVTLSTVSPSSSAIVVWVDPITTAGATVNIQRGNPQSALTFQWTAIEPG